MAESGRVLWIADWELKPEAARLQRGGETVKLTPKNMDVLVFLAERAGEVVTLHELLVRFWRGEISSPNAVHKCMTELRRALRNGDGEAIYIETVPKRGYRLVAPVRICEAAPPRPADATRDSTESAKLTTNGVVLAESVAQRPTRLGRPLIAFPIAALAIIAVLAGLWMVDQAQSPRVVSFASHSATLQPGPGSTVSDAAWIQAIFDKASASFAEADTAMAGDTLYTVMLSLDRSGTAWRAELTMTPRTRDRTTHHEEIVGSSDDPGGFETKVTTHLTRDLQILLDDERLAEMATWGTRNVHAYDLARQGDTFQVIETAESSYRAAEFFRAALGEDPAFPYAYGSLAAVYRTIAQAPTDLRMHEDARRQLLGLLRDARSHLSDGVTLRWIEQAYGWVSAGSAYDAEDQARRDLLADPESVQALRFYARLLMGAKLQLEAEAYLDRAVEILAAQGHPGVEFAEFATLATIRGERETAIRIMKKAISSVPDATLSTFGLVQHLTKVGRRAEAEIFLARLQASDAVWGAAAELLMHAIAGELPAGSAELDAALNDDLPHIARGMACFDVGDIDRGIREWQQFEPAFLRQLWEFLPSMETYYSPGVVNDERYQTQIRNLGVGRPWRAYMRERVAELAPITGIPLTSPIAEEDVST